MGRLTTIKDIRNRNFIEVRGVSTKEDITGVDDAINWLIQFETNKKQMPEIKKKGMEKAGNIGGVVGGTATAAVFACLALTGLIPIVGGIIAGTVGIIGVFAALGGTYLGSYLGKANFRNKMTSADPSLGNNNVDCAHVASKHFVKASKVHQMTNYASSYGLYLAAYKVMLLYYISERHLDGRLRLIPFDETYVQDNMTSEFAMMLLKG